MIDPHSFPMTQLLTGVGQMAFQTIGFHAALILNKLRNERLKSAVDEDAEARDRTQERNEEDARNRLAFVKRRLADLAAFEDRASGRFDKKRRGSS